MAYGSDPESPSKLPTNHQARPDAFGSGATARGATTIGQAIDEIQSIRFLTQMDVINAVGKIIWRAGCISGRMHQQSDLELIACGKDGDRESVAELFRRYYPVSLGVARTILRRGDESEDAVQKAYLLAFRHFQEFRGDASFKTWLTRIVVNCCLLELRTARRRVTWVRPEDSGVEVLASEGLTPEKSTWCREIAEACSDAARTLPRNLCEVYKLHLVSGLSLKEVAITLGVTESAAKTRLYRARVRMRAHLEPLWSDLDCAHRVLERRGH